MSALQEKCLAWLDSVGQGARVRGVLAITRARTAPHLPALGAPGVEMEGMMEAAAVAFAVSLELAKSAARGLTMDPEGLRLFGLYLRENPHALAAMRKVRHAKPELQEVHNTILARAQAAARRVG